MVFGSSVTSVELEPCRITELFPGVSASLVQDLHTGTVVRSVAVARLQEGLHVKHSGHLLYLKRGRGTRLTLYV